MAWYEIAIAIVGALGGTGGIISLYTAKAKKSTIEIDNFKKLFDEAQEERKNIREMHQDYVKETDNKIAGLEQKVINVEAKNNHFLRTLYTAYKCKLPKTSEDCPVLSSLEKDTVLKNNINKENFQ